MSIKFGLFTLKELLINMEEVNYKEYEIYIQNYYKTAQNNIKYCFM